MNRALLVLISLACFLICFACLGPGGPAIQRLSVEVAEVLKDKLVTPEELAKLMGTVTEALNEARSTNWQEMALTAIGTILGVKVMPERFLRSPLERAPSA